MRSGGIRISMNNRLFYGTIGASLLLTLYFLCAAWSAGYRIWGNNLDFGASGQVGDFIGGTVGTLFAGGAFYLLYLTLIEQRDAFKKQKFENSFHEMIRIHRENTAELSFEMTTIEKNERGVLAFKREFFFKRNMYLLQS
jgi:hypothetical protein